MRITSMEVRGFKSFSSLGLKPRAVNLIAGSPGSGKSNFLSALALVAALGRGETVAESLEAAGPIDPLHCLWSGPGPKQRARSFTIDLDLRADGNDGSECTGFRSRLQIGVRPEEGGFEILEYHLDGFKGPKPRRLVRLSRHDIHPYIEHEGSGYKKVHGVPRSRLPSSWVKHPERHRNVLAVNRFLETSVVLRPQVTGADADGVRRALGRMSRTGLEALAQDFCRVFPARDGFRVHAGHRAGDVLFSEFPGGVHQPVCLAGDSALRVLGLLSGLAEGAPPGITVVDGFGMELGREHLENLLAVMDRAFGRGTAGQVFLLTGRSDVAAVLAAHPPPDMGLFVMDRRARGSRIRQVEAVDFMGSKVWLDGFVARAGS